MINNINEVIADLTKIDNASAMIMESTKKAKIEYADEIKRKTKEFDDNLSADIEEKVKELKDSLVAENEELIKNCKRESEDSLKQLDSLYSEKKDQWVESIFNKLIKE